MMETINDDDIDVNDVNDVNHGIDVNNVNDFNDVNDMNDMNDVYYDENHISYFEADIRQLCVHATAQRILHIIRFPLIDHPYLQYGMTESSSDRYTVVMPGDFKRYQLILLLSAIHIIITTTITIIIIIIFNSIIFHFYHHHYHHYYYNYH